LEPLKKINKLAIGIDPSINVGKIANKKGLKTFIGFFNKKLIKKILIKYPKPDLIVASSVVTHLENPERFARDIKSFLKRDGVLIIEIEYLINFIKNTEFERFYFDRPFYYSAYTINYLFKKIGMTLYDIEKINIHGGSIRCFVKHNSKIKKTIRCKKVIIGYGAPARVSAITNIAKINNELINFIIDDSPLKQYRFTPGMHIKILPKKNNISDKIDIVIVFAYEYFRDIKENFRNVKVVFYKPIPFRKLR